MELLSGSGRVYSPSGGLEGLGCVNSLVVLISENMVWNIIVKSPFGWVLSMEWNEAHQAPLLTYAKKAEKMIYFLEKTW